MHSAERLLDQADQLLGVGRFAEAEAAVEAALRADSKSIRGLCIKAIIAAETGRADVAIPAIERALKLGPRMPAVLNNAAGVFARCGQVKRAVDLWKWLAATSPKNADAHHNIGVVLATSGDAPGAEAAFRKVISLAPDHPSVYMNLADTLKSAGRIEEAVAIAREGARRRPDDARMWGSYLYSLYFDPSATPASIHADHAAWGKRFESAIPVMTGHTNDRSTERPLRIGYLSPHFREHATMFFVASLFRGIDRARYETWVYSCNLVDDAVTELLRSRATTWRDASRLSDEALAQQIAADKIDILVDLNMHMTGSRLGVLARRPAPVQAVWAAYPGTTGLSRIDYTILDPFLAPGLAARAGTLDRAPSAEFTEIPYILPHCYWCYEPMGARPDVSALPADAAGHITFGSLNNFGKVTGDLLDSWARIMQRTPGSRLLLFVEAGGIAQGAVARLGRGGVAPERVECVGRAGREEYLRRYHRIDIVLDTFPYTGHTTTCDALWMGVPVVSRAGETCSSRGALSILSNVGLAGLVGASGDAYESIAATLAEDVPQLRKLRASLRERVERSPVMDATGFGAAMGAAYSAMWEAWARR